MNEQPKFDSQILEVTLETRYHLFESLLVNGVAGSHRIKMHLVNAFSEEPNGAPACNEVCQFFYKPLPFRQRQVDVGICLTVVFPDLLVAFVIFLLYSEELHSSCPANLGPALMIWHRFKTRDRLLFNVRSHHPSHMDLLVRQTVPCFDRF